MVRRRETSVTPPRTGVVPPELAVFDPADWSSPDDAVPEHWVREPLGYYGSRQEQEARHRYLTAWRRHGTALYAWADEQGWTRRQASGYRHPSWIACGWADEPPVKR